MSSNCPACGLSPTTHGALWLSNSGDIFALGFADHRKNPVVTTLVTIGEWTISFVSGFFFTLGRMVRIFTLHDDIEKATSERSRVMWEEANARGISMQQVYFLGSPLDLYRIEMNGKHYLVDSIPLPPSLHQEVLHIDDKISFKKLMRDSGLPTPQSYGASTLGHAKKILSELSRVCVKPRSGSNGFHTYPHITTETELEAAYKSAKEICHFVSVEEHLEGNVCRATCIGGKFVGFLESMYPTVTGDGVSTISTLIERANTSRPEGVEEIVINPIHEGYIQRRGYALEDILPEGVSLPLTYRAGASSGGRNMERGRNIHESFIPLIEKAAILTELPVVGFDLIIPDPLQPADSQVWGFIEANSLPWINLHHTPFSGEPVNIASHVWGLWD